VVSQTISVDCDHIESNRARIFFHFIDIFLRRGNQARNLTRAHGFFGGKAGEAFFDLNEDEGIAVESDEVDFAFLCFESTRDEGVAELS